jgi:hypothetical protein
LQKAAGSNLPCSHLVTAGGTAAPRGNVNAVVTLFSLHQQPPNFALQPTVARHSPRRQCGRIRGRATAAERWSVGRRMIEGWAQERHFILFTDEEATAATTRYGFPDSLPGYVVVGLLGWDDFIVRSGSGDLFTLPTIPSIEEYLEPYHGELPHQLEGDGRAGTIKWYVKPLVFGGSPEAGENMIWVTHNEHAELVRWWNAQYQTANSQPGAADA